MDLWGILQRFIIQMGSNFFWEYYIDKKLYITPLMELLAVICGLIYLRKSPEIKKSTRFFFYYLLTVMILDNANIYSLVAYASNYKYFGFIKDTPFAANYWGGSIIFIVIFFCYIYFFRFHIMNEKYRKWIGYGLVVFLLFSIVDLVFITDFFYTVSLNIYIVGTFFTISCIALYFNSLLRSKDLLNFYTEFEFYAACGILIYYLSIAPIYIYINFIKVDPFFFKVYGTIVQFSNIYLYVMFCLGFLVELSNRRKEALSITA